MQKDNPLDIVKRNLFRLIRTGVFGDKEPLEPMTLSDWRTLLDLTLEQAVTGPAYDGLLQYVESKELDITVRMKLNWMSVVEGTDRVNKAINGTLVSLFSIFKDARLRPVLLKGQGLATLYPSPLHRSCGDIDVFFPLPDQADQADQWARENGTDCDDSDYKHLSYEWNGIKIENHHKMQVLLNKRLNRRLQDIVERELETNERAFVQIDGTTIEILPSTLNLLLIVLHIFHHALNEGVGLKQIVDLGVFLRKAGNIDYQKFREWMQELEMQKVADAIGGLCIQLFRFDKADIPFMSAYDEKLTRRITSDIFKGGNMGNKVFGFKQQQGNFLAKKSKAMMLHFCKSARYYRYCPREVVSNFTAKFAHSLKETNRANPPHNTTKEA